ncbi:MAG: hypothetical protein HQM04_14290 [Magnetococcales bacterium]|nr:hypothetical protein [Magnetococcales bacterium]MBF0116194.1 hypothetical protein [Magnetococcales bacterium]
MKKLKTVQILVIMALSVLLPQLLNAAPAGQWNAGGYTQWHANDGQTPMGSVGTQCFFCKPDPAAPAKELNTGIAPLPAAPQPTPPYHYGNSGTVKKKSAASTSMKKAAKKPAKKGVVAKKSSKKKAVAKKSGKKHAVHKKHAQKKVQQHQVKKNTGY